jgi:hypothetical protein
MQTEGSLEIGEYVVHIFTGIVFGDNAVSFDRRAGVARVANVDADAMRSFRERALWVAVTNVRSPTTLLLTAGCKSGESAVAAATGSTTADKGR